MCFSFVCLFISKRKKSRRRTCRKRTRREFSSIIGMRQVRAEKRKHVEKGKRKEIRGDEREGVFRVPGKPMILKEGRMRTKRRNEATKSKASTLHCVADPAFPPCDGVNSSFALFYFSCATRQFFGGLQLSCLFIVILSMFAKRALSHILLISE